MGIIKKTIFSAMGFILLIMFISYGISLLFGEQSTYLLHSAYTTNSGYTFTKYTWDYISWSNNLKTNEIWNNLDSYIFSIEHLGAYWEKALQGINNHPANFWEAAINVLNIIFSGLITILNILSFSINLLILGPFQLIHALLYYVLTLVGINMTQGSWWLPNYIWFVNQNIYIPMVWNY